MASYDDDDDGVDFDHCFICHERQDLSDEHPGRWLPLRPACGEHRRLAVLPTGEIVDEFVDRRESDEYPFEGRGLNAVINPVTIKGRRGWCDFFMGGPVVFGEIFPSNDYFEYSVQHFPEYLNELWSLALRNSRFPKRLRCLRRLREYNTTLDSISFDWKRQKILSAYLKGRGKPFPETPEEAVHIACLNGGFVLGEWFRWAFRGILERDLLVIAEKRFAHLPKDDI